MAEEYSFTFFKYLWAFYVRNRKSIRRGYTDITKKYLQFNDPDPEEGGAFLRQPQFEALEMYVFLKEGLSNDRMPQIFDAWLNKKGVFEGRSDAGALGEQADLFGNIDEDAYESAFSAMKKSAAKAPYANYIFALTMGTGKTILMATCIFYEFLLANKYPKDVRFCHNALVLAPDLTVLQSLREIQTFDRSKVVPQEYVSVLDGLLTFHFLEEAGVTLNTLPNSRFNLIISNGQKIILKERHKERTPGQELFRGERKRYKSLAGEENEEQSSSESTGSFGKSGAFAARDELYDFDSLDNENDLTMNQRFEKLRRLEQLGVYVDEAHHAFGNKLERDLGRRITKKSLRRTINLLSKDLKSTGTHMVACYNYTGTPYAKGKIFPEVVYAYGLQEAIDNGYLKKVRVSGYSNPKTDEFVHEVIGSFVKKHRGEDGTWTRYEKMLPKMAFFATSIEELQTELRPAVERALADVGIATSRVLVNVGDEKITSSDDIREFNRLDTPDSEKQFILLVGKGNEGWDCRSLFSVALYRKPKGRGSKIFVLQASMRCLRAIDPPQQTGHVFLSEANMEILDEELNQNFRIGLKDFQNAGTDKTQYAVRPVPPPREVEITRKRRLHDLKEKDPQPGIQFGFDGLDTDRYRLIRTDREGLSEASDEYKTDLTEKREQRQFSPLTLTAEIARYLNRSPIEIERVLSESQEGMDRVVEAVNEFNELLYDHVIPKLFDAFYDIESYERTEKEKVLLIRQPEDGAYHILAYPEDVIKIDDSKISTHASKSFHVDTYCFDSKPEQRFFYDAIQSESVRQVYFTGMFTHGQSEFFIQYIDPESHAVRSYYPDFLVEKMDGTWLIVEVKGDNKVDDPVVQAKKAFAEEMAESSQMSYRLVKGSDIKKGLGHAVFAQ